MTKRYKNEYGNGILRAQSDGVSFFSFDAYLPKTGSGVSIIENSGLENARLTSSDCGPLRGRFQYLFEDTDFPLPITAEFTEWLDPSLPAAIRYCRSQRPFSLTLATSEDITVSYVKKYRIGKSSCECIIITYPPGDPRANMRMYIALFDGFSFDEATSEISFSGILGSIAVTYGEQSSAARALSATFSFARSDSPYGDPQNRSFADASIAQRKLLSRAVYTAPSEEMASSSFAITTEIDLYLRRVLSSMRTDGLVYDGTVFDPSRSVSHIYALPALGMTDEAAKLARRLCEIRRNLGFLPGKGTDFGGASSSYSVDIELARALIATDLPEFDRSALLLMKNVLRGVSAGMLPFEPFAVEFANFALPSTYRFHGCAQSTLSFILAAEAFLKNDRLLTADKSLSAKIASSLAYIKENFVRLFFLDGKMKVNAPLRDASIKRPHLAFGFCDVCEILDGRPNPTLLEYGASGYYRCPACISRRTPKLDAQADPIRPDAGIVEYASAADAGIIPESAAFSVISEILSGSDTLGIREMSASLPLLAKYSPDLFRRMLSDISYRRETYPQTISLCDHAFLVTCAIRSLEFGEQS